MLVLDVRCERRKYAHNPADGHPLSVVPVVARIAGSGADILPPVRGVEWRPRRATTSCRVWAPGRGVTSFCPAASAGAIMSAGRSRQEISVLAGVATQRHLRVSGLSGSPVS